MPSSVTPNGRTKTASLLEVTESSVPFLSVVTERVAVAERRCDRCDCGTNLRSTSTTREPSSASATSSGEARSSRSFGCVHSASRLIQPPP
eukprot:scaffold114828_cov27-Tisochrysis_lutea.AAC.2